MRKIGERARSKETGAKVKGKGTRAFISTAARDDAIDAKSTTEHDGSSLEIGKQVTLTIMMYVLLLY